MFRTYLDKIGSPLCSAIKSRDCNNGLASTVVTAKVHQIILDSMSDSTVANRFEDMDGHVFYTSFDRAKKT